MAKAFFFQDLDLVWWGGTFKADGVTPDVKSRMTAGHYRDRWETVNEVLQFTLRNATNLGEIDPFRSIPITEIASDLTGTPYDEATFLAATKDFFFRVSASSGKLPESVVMAGVLDQVDYELTGKVVDTSAFYYAIVDQVIMSKGAELSILSGTDSIATFTAAPNDGATIIFVFYTV